MDEVDNNVYGCCWCEYSMHCNKDKDGEWETRITTDKANNREKVRILALTCATNCLKDEITFRYPKKYGNMQHATGNKIQLWVFPNNLVAVS